MISPPIGFSPPPQSVGLQVANRVFRLWVPNVKNGDLLRIATWNAAGIENSLDEIEHKIEGLDLAICVQETLGSA